MWRSACPTGRLWKCQNKRVWKNGEGFFFLCLFRGRFAVLRLPAGREALSDKSRQIVRERTHFFAPRAAILYLTKRGSAEGDRKALLCRRGRGDDRLYRIRLCGERAPRRIASLSRPAMRAPSGERMASRARLCRGRGAGAALPRPFAARVAELSRQISRRRSHCGDRLSFAAAQTVSLGLCRFGSVPHSFF